MAEPAGSIRRDALLSTTGVLLSGGAQFGISLIVGQLGGPTALGQLRGGLSLANAASLLWPSTAGQAASLYVARELGAENARVADAVQRHLTKRVGQAVLLTAPATALLALLLVPGYSPLDAAWAAALVVALAGYHLARGIRFGRGRVVRATLWEVANAAASLGLIALVLGAGSPGWLLAPLVAGNGLYAAGLLGRKPAGDALADPLRRELDQFVVWGVAGTMASAGLMQISMVVASAARGGVEAGWYAAAVSLGTPLSMIARALSLALVPSLARSVGGQDPEGMRRRTDRATRGLVVLLVPAFVSMMLVAEPLLGLLYGPEFAPAVLSLRILLGAVLASSVAVASVNAITVRGRAGIRLAAILSWTGLLAGLATIGLLVGPWGIEGIATGYLVGTVITAGAAWVHVWARDRHRWVGITLAVVGTPTAATAYLVASPASGWAQALTAVACLAAAWAAGLLLLRRCRYR